mmetsp:Transcript_46461/g.67954  ORF Transcript_46461/g.67954 Transcript_46461/m.67954 type:complete len:301 (-) Transcript_46461:283-1185(-)|eukprot:CAMPEP_0206388406 /NCGR_PEP_ID=MMETSP0294-20121207/17250_1 /ASSEMBLY_ACC=CAM_ASM_000327 /TAXON_ID=39354 /ORGANISM="Heterosigma akashiwo, Strain CCMP2393" /LENGTH=300 /DNA_ID=CAMNT_0053840099 /DNA_START=14 /DNA_END=916 /DNA_ORIENTATION=-
MKATLFRVVLVTLLAVVSLFQTSNGFLVPSCSPNKYFAGYHRKSQLLVTKIEEVPEEEANELYVLEEPETGKVIECYLDSFAIINDVRYAIAFPKDWAVSIATENEDGILDPIDPSDEIMDDMFPWLADYLAKDDIEIMHTPVTLTLMGEFMEDDEDDDEDDDEEWEDEEEEEIDWVKEDGESAELREVTPEELEALNLKMAEQGGGEDLVASADSLVGEGAASTHDLETLEDEVDLIATFWYKEKEYSLLKLLDPVLMVAKHREGNRYELLSEEEAEDVNPKIEYLVEKFILNNEEEDD